MFVGVRGLLQSYVGQFPTVDFGAKLVFPRITKRMP